MALFRKSEAAQESKRKNLNVEELYADRRGDGRIIARIIDAKSGLKVISGVFAIRMLDEGERRLFMNDYTPTIGKVVGDVVLVTSHGEECYRGIRGFYKMQHNEFTLLVEGRIEEENT